MKITGNIYRQFLSGLFLALYVFITLPVQYWHHHPASTYTIEKEDIYSSIKVSNDESTFTVDCTICSHQYATYCADSELRFIALSKSVTLINANHSQSLVRYIRDALFNKGPPTII
ncbi:MAG: hypothetical protein IBJ16_14390 [Chitinophagaceae bacterium]|nr:hypothetical protein [Chitinophagaceae bacterium]